MDTYGLLKKYTEIPGPMGHEHRVQKEFMGDLRPYTDEIKLTNVGNVLAHFPAEGRKIVIFGHADEIASYVLSITDDGFLHISRGRGGKVAYPYCLVGQKALVIGDSEDVRGAFISGAGHVLTAKEREAPLENWKIYVDIGASSSEEVEERGIHVGSPIIWNPTTERLGKKVFGKAMDDRFTYPVMLGIAEKIQGEELSCDLYMASTVLEEVGLRGAQSLSRHGFDIGIALDIGIAGDYPALPKGRMPIKLGGGPVLVWRDAGIVYNVDTIRELRETAERHDLPYQHGIFENYGSDGVSMVLGGTKPNLVATPCRYSHMPIEMMHLDDIDQTVELLYRYVTD
ncbi:MAG: M42 family peptidase [Candidatus Bathyarchaeota archaeon]|nr:MAG: M42 family peptidase [Candidatus Bathyarchaeota archaeon]